ncbi:MAG: AI-2E family transporter [Rhizobiales bacterium]|nr:AI-2E family transporter [Hyphomicrobiales bacterium]
MAVNPKFSPVKGDPTGAATLRRQVIFWIAALAAFIAFLWVFSEILLPFVAGMALAYLFDPLVRRLQGRGVPRAVAALSVIAIVIIAFILAVTLIAPILGDQIAAFIERMPGYVQQLQALLADSNRPWLTKLVDEKLPDASKSVGTLVTQGAGYLASFLKSLWSGGKALVSLISLLVITPVVTFYLLVDWDRMVGAVDSWTPLQHRVTVRRLAREIDDAVSGFVRGQALVCVILGVFYALGLIIVGVNFGLLIGLGAGILSFIPYIGTIVGLIVATGIALAQFWPSFWPVLAVVGIFAFGQAVEGNVLQPYLVGKTIGLHPVWLMFSLLAFGYLFGFVGLLVAIPVAAAIGVLTRFGLRQYLASSYYTGSGID